MAKTINLVAPASRRVTPFTTVYGRLETPGVNHLHINAGMDLDIPNHWEMFRGNIVYQADANVANRMIYIYSRGDDPAGGIQGDEIESIAITASQTKEIILSRVTDRNNLKSTTSEFQALLLPGAFFIRGNHYIIMSISDAQAGDKITYAFEFRFLNWELGLEDPRETTPGSSPDPVQKPKSFWECLGF